MNSKSKSQSHKRFYRSLLSSLILSNRVITTKTRAKTLKSEAQNLLSSIASSKDNLEKIKYLRGFLYGGAIDKAFKEIDGRETIRTYNYKNRSGDGALQAVVEINKNQESAGKISKSKESK